jgi:hypothetical protein
MGQGVEKIVGGVDHGAIEVENDGRAAHLPPLWLPRQCMTVMQAARKWKCGLSALARGAT